jgi:hypothetical protein
MPVAVTKQTAVVVGDAESWRIEPKVKSALHESMEPSFLLSRWMSGMTYMIEDRGR